MGILLGVTNAAVLAFMNTQLRRLEGVDAHLINWLRFAFGSLAIALLVTLFSGWSLPPLPFWIAILGVVVPSDFLGTYFYTRAFQSSHQSLVGPLFAFSSVFAIPAGYALFGELPKLAGYGGVALVLLGVLALGWDFGKPGVLKSLAHIFQERGSLFMLGAAVAAVGVLSGAKLAIQYGSPLLAGFFNVITLLAISTFFVSWRKLSELGGRWRNALAVAVLDSLDVVLTYSALSLLLLAYFTAVKRTSAVFDVIFGRLFSGEPETGRRLVGAVVAVAGVALIALAR